MSSPDSASSSSSYYDIRDERGRVLYNSNHNVEVTFNHGETVPRNVSFTVVSLDNALKFKVRDVFDYSFNYTALIDWSVFDKMKREQALDITFDELLPQIVELLKLTLSKQMLMKIEANDLNCKVIFYEKSRIKSLILLAIELKLTNQKEVVEEMSLSIRQLKDKNNAISTQMALSKRQLHDTQILLKNAMSKNNQLEKQFFKDLDIILQTFLTHLAKTEAAISSEIIKLTKRHQKVLNIVEVVRNENLSRCSSTARLVQNIQSLKLQSEQNERNMGELRAEIQIVNALKSRLESDSLELKQTLASKDKELDDLNKQLAELKRDVQDATMIITQKTKTNDEIGKDLVQANQMLVKFNDRYDSLTIEATELKEKLCLKEQIIRDQALELDRVNREFGQYRTNFDAEEIKKLEHELFHARQRMEELEKQNKEVIKLNGLLTKKISSENILENRNPNRMLPNL